METKDALCLGWNAWALQWPAGLWIVKTWVRVCVCVCVHLKTFFYNFSAETWNERECRIVLVDTFSELRVGPHGIIILSASFNKILQWFSSPAVHTIPSSTNYELIWTQNQWMIECNIGGVKVTIVTDLYLSISLQKLWLIKMSCRYLLTLSNK